MQLRRKKSHVLADSRLNRTRLHWVVNFLAIVLSILFRRGGDCVVGCATMAGPRDDSSRTPMLVGGALLLVLATGVTDRCFVKKNADGNGCDCRARDRKDRCTPPGDRSRFFISPKWRAWRGRKRSGQRMHRLWNRELSAEREARRAVRTRWRIHWNSESRFKQQMRIRRKGRRVVRSSQLRTIRFRRAQGSSLNLVFQNRQSTLSCCGRSDKIIDFSSGTESPRFAVSLSGWFQRPIMVRISFFINVQLRLCSLQNNAFGRAVKTMPVNALADGDAGYLLPATPNREPLYSSAATTHRIRR